MTAAQTHATATETVAVLGAGGTMGFPITQNLAATYLTSKARSDKPTRPLAGEASSRGGSVRRA